MTQQNVLQKKLNGVFTALVTPFTDSGAIDWGALDRLLELQLQAGVDGLVVLGTTGEASTLSDSESSEMIEHVRKRVGAQTCLLAGTGSNNTSLAIEKTKRAVDLGVDGVLLVSPYYNRPSQDGLLKHFSAVAAATSTGIVLYNIPGRCGVDISPETVARLAADHANIVGIKEASGTPARVSELRLEAPEGFAIHCGDDELAPAFYAHGAVGLTSVLSNIEPAICVAMHRAFVRGNWSDLLAMHECAQPLIKSLFCDSNPGPIKYLLSILGISQPDLRLPLVVPSPSAQIHLKSAWAAYLGQRSLLKI